MFRCLWQCSLALAVAALIAGVSSSLGAAAADEGGRRLVAAAGGALGSPEARRAAAELRAEHRGMSYPLEQARSPADAVGAARRVYRWRIDAPRGRLLREAEQHFPGGIFFWTRTALTPGGGWGIDVLKWRSGTDLQPLTEVEALRPRLQWERLFPHLLIRQAELAAGSEAAGPDAFRFRDAAGVLVEVRLDPATRLPASAREIGAAGPQPELVYGDYRRRRGVLFAHSVRSRQGERTAEELRLAEVRTGAPAAAEFEPPSGYVPPPAAAAPRLRELAPGVLFFENMPFGNHSMAVDMGDHLVLIEAPSSPEAGNLQRRLLEEARPGKPVRYVLVTHHHGDHTAGLDRWAEAGATIVVPSGAEVAIERQVRGRGYRGPLPIERVEARRSFGSRANLVEAHSFASSHASAHMIMHLPGRRILFQGDLFYLPERGEPPPAFPVVRELQALIARLGLGVDVIVGVHGRPATAAQMRQSLARRLPRRRVRP